MSWNRKWLWSLGVLLFIVVGWWFFGGKDELSLEAYKFTQSIYAACLSRSEARLQIAEEQLNGDAGNTLPANEKKRLKSMIHQAKNGHWTRVRDRARKMMQNQVKAAT